MTEAEKKAFLTLICHCKAKAREAFDTLNSIQQFMEGIETNQSTDDEEFDDWSDEIEARIDRLEQRMAWYENNKLDQLKDVLNR